MNADEPLIACPPVKPIAGVPPFQPRSGFTVTTCSVCACDCWMGPRQKATSEKQPCLIVCMPCAIKGGARLENVQHLGG